MIKNSHNTNGFLYGNLTHSNAFKKISYINVKSDNLYCLNTTSEQNEVYFGNVFAKGIFILMVNQAKFILILTLKQKMELSLIFHFQWKFLLIVI